jgi:predicted HTH transcriptional regulator
MEFDSPRLLELLRNPAEDLAFEIKEWLNLSDNAHKARLAQALIALANHGGGAVLIGYAEQGNGSFIPAEPRPADLSGYTSDVVNEISRAYLNPPVHCDVRHIAHPDTGFLFPVISVPGGHSIPIMARRGGPQGQSTASIS